MDYTSRYKGLAPYHTFCVDIIGGHRHSVKRVSIKTLHKHIYVFIYYLFFLPVKEQT